MCLEPTGLNLGMFTTSALKAEKRLRDTLDWQPQLPASPPGQQLEAITEGNNSLLCLLGTYT